MAKKENNKKAVRTDKDKKVSKLNRAIYSAIDPTYGYPTGLAIPAAGIKAGISLFSPDDMTYEVTDSVADAAWRKRLGLSYDDKFIIPNKDGSYRLPKNVEREIPVDTTFLKKRIANNEKLLKGNSVKGKAYNLVKNMNKLDKETLEALRKTYKTGEPVVINDYSHNNRQLIEDGELIKGAETYISPLNVLQNYTIQYNPKNNSMLYRDVYDFNGYESFVPGESFNIEGEIPLNRKYFIGGLLGSLGTANTNATNSFMNSGLGKGLSGLGVKAGGLGGIANTAATAIGGLLAGKNKTGVGSAMQTVGSLASNIPGVGGIIGAGVNLLGGVVNAAFGSSINKEFVNQTEQAARQQSEYTSGASTNEQLLSDYSGLSFMGDVSKKDVGSDGWFSNKASKKTRALNEAIDNANFRALTSLGNTAENIDKQNDLSLMANYSAYGGPVRRFSNGGNIAQFINSNEEINAFNKALSTASYSTGGEDQLIQNSLGRNDGSGWFGVASKAGMATYDMLNIYRNLTKSERTPIGKKIGLFANGGNMNSYLGAAESAAKLIGNAINEANNLEDTTEIKKGIRNFGDTTFGGTNDDLMDQWSNTSFLSSNVSTRDIRDKSYFDDFLTSVPASFEGFNAGSSWGPWGAAIGGIVGGSSSVIGSLIGRNKAKKEARRLNKLIDENNARVKNAFDLAVENNEKDLNISLLSNYSAYGGPIKMKYERVTSPFDNQFKDGGIYIKPSHRGRLTKLKERTGKTEAELYNDGNPAHKKMVVFARNARKWKHADGGPLDGQSELDLLEARSNKARALVGKPNEFFDTWNEARLQTGRFNDQLGEGILERQKQRRDSAPIFNNLNAFADISYTRGTTPGLLNGETPREAANRYNKNKSKYAQSTVDKLRDKAQGAYWESPNTIYVDPKYPEALIHEQAHASHAKEQEDKIEEILGNSDMYKDRKGEIYSRLMQFREKNNLNPNTVWDKESLKELKKNAVDFSILNRYNDDEVLRLLNEVADTGDIDNFISKNNKVNYAAEGGQLFTNGVTTIGNGGTHEQNPFEGVQMGVDPEGIPNLVEEGEVIYNDYVYSNRLKPSEELKKKYKIRGITFADAAKQIQKESEERPNDPIAKDTLKAIMLDLQNEQDMVRSKNNNNKHAEGGRLAHKYSGEETDSQVMARAKAKRQGHNVGSSLDDYLENPIYENTESTIAPIKDSILRYAPAIGSGLAVINDWFGGNEPNYTNADLFQRAIEGSKRDITFKPVGNYLRYNPLDRDYYTNKLSANAAASRRGAINTSGGNRAAALAGLLASDYNYGNQLGDLARQAEEYNLAQRQRVEEFNRGTNTTNAEMSLRSQMANAEQAADRARMYASLAGMRQELLDRNRAEKSSNLTNFLQNLGNIGRETVDKDMLRWLADKDALRGIRACGGKIRRKKRGGFTV